VDFGTSVLEAAIQRWLLERSDVYMHMPHLVESGLTLPLGTQLEVLLRTKPMPMLYVALTKQTGW